ncbi:DNA/RNA helicase domain-containing protein [Rossellomorea sp. NS-SX7]
MIKEEIILNSINVLMKRGISGLYIYATDPKLRNRLLELQCKGDKDYE